MRPLEALTLFPFFVTIVIKKSKNCKDSLKILPYLGLLWLGCKVPFKMKGSNIVLKLLLLAVAVHF